MTNKQIQTNLQFLGFYFGGIDGIMGSGTARAESLFKAEFGSDNYPDSLIQVVKEIQEIVDRYYPKSIAIDGLAGSQTIAATKAFQSAVGLTADGIAGKLTRTMIKSITSEDKIVIPPSAPGGSDGFWGTVKHFSRSEFKCPCPRCGGYPTEPKEALVRVADLVREHFNAPITISSGVRCQAHNDELSGSVPNSRHVQGKAMDFSVKGKSGSVVNAYCQSLVRTGKLRYAYLIGGDWVHMDVL